MSATILSWSLLAALVLLALAMVVASFRMLRGPRAQDRIGAMLPFGVVQFGPWQLHPGGPP